MRKPPTGILVKIAPAWLETRNFCPPALLALQNHLCHCEPVSVSNREVGAYRAKFPEEFLGAPVKCDRRTRAGLATHFHILPGDAPAPSCSEGLHGCFFRGEAGGVALYPVRF